MSEQRDNTMLIGALLVGLYLYSRSTNQAAIAIRRPGGVPTMPGSAGTGMQQVAAGALSGIFQALASGVKNSAYGVTPSLYNAQQAATDYAQSGTVQDIASDQWDEGPSASLFA